MMSEVKKLSRGISWVIESFKKLPRLVRLGIMAVFMILLSKWIPWGWFGEVGSYIQVGLILGGIFMLIRVFEQYYNRGKNWIDYLFN